MSRIPNLDPHQSGAILRQRALCPALPPRRQNHTGDWHNDGICPILGDRRVLPRLAVYFLVLAGILSANVAYACKGCGGKGKADWLAREREPKASQLYPHATIVEYTLDIAESSLAPAGRPVRALTVNGSVPGPTLRFSEGDVARILVRNHLSDDETSIHWHGLLVPNLEDGVPYITTPPILAGESRTFEFLLKHAGTYWYHSHTGLQEQRGVYGSIVIEPKTGSAPHPHFPRVDRDEVIVLSDWTNENPEDVMQTLLRGSNWYAIRKASAQSVIGAAKAGQLREYFSRERSRMQPMDVSDVAYDAFLVNGRPRYSISGKPGETIRLRVINAAASTYFYLSSATGPLKIVAADGMNVVPIRQRRLLIGMAETYDLLVTIPDLGAWEVRATAQDNSGYASLILGSGTEHSAPAPGHLNTYSMNDALTAVLDQLDEADRASDDEALHAESDRPLPPYKRLRSPTRTTLPTEAPKREVTLKLTGDMNRYLWSINDQAIDEQSTVAVNKGEILRLVLVNNTMMHHPMHLHGHFFRLIDPDADETDYAPLKHTVDVPPMSRRIIEFYANEDRDWLFHCHLLFHMKAGMARILSYPAGAEMSARGTQATGSSALSGQQGYTPNLGEHARPHTYSWADLVILSQMSMGFGTIQRGRSNLNLAYELGWEKVAQRDYEIEATYSRYFNARWTAFAGYRRTNIGEGRDAGIVGAVYRLPYFADLTGSVQTNGKIRLALGKMVQISSRLSLSTRAKYDTAENFSWQAGLSYTLSKRFSLISMYDSAHDLGAGLGIRF